MDNDQYHLKLLSIFHYIVAFWAAMFALIPIIRIVIYIILIIASVGRVSNDVLPLLIIFMFSIIFSLCLILVCLTLAFFIAVNGLQLSKHKWYKFCTVITAIECIFVPLGTILGVFTLLVLTRESVKKLFEENITGAKIPTE